jgi:hypothetical protein
MAVFLLNDQAEAIDLSKIEHLDVPKREIRYVSGAKQKLSNADFSAVLQKMTEAGNVR